MPNLGRIINRRPSYDLTPQRTDDTGSETSSQTAVEVPTLNTIPTLSTDEAVEEGTEVGLSESEDARRKRRFSISSQLDESHYAVLPHLFTVDDWDEEEVKALNNHVRHQMHSKRAKFKRQMRGFRKYASKRTSCSAISERRTDIRRSTWLFRHLVCSFDNPVWSNMGVTNDR